MGPGPIPGPLELWRRRAPHPKSVPLHPLPKNFYPLKTEFFRIFFRTHGNASEKKVLTLEKIVLRRATCLKRPVSYSGFFVQGRMNHIGVLQLAPVFLRLMRPFSGILAFSLAQQFTANNCPAAAKYGKGPPASCTGPKDPLNKPASAIEQWLTRDVFYVRRSYFTEFY